MIKAKQIGIELALIFSGGYAFISIFYIILDFTISFLIFLFSGDFKSFLSDAFNQASMMCPTVPFCILDWQPKKPMVGLNLILSSILSAQHSFEGRVVSAVISASLFALLMVVYLKQNFEIFVKPSRVEKIIHAGAIIAITALFIPTMIAYFGGFMLGIFKIFGWD
jgi:hypothetical protein